MAFTKEIKMEREFTLTLKALDMKENGIQTKSKEEAFTTILTETVILASFSIPCGMAKENISITQEIDISENGN